MALVKLLINHELGFTEEQQWELAGVVRDSTKEVVYPHRDPENCDVEVEPAKSLSKIAMSVNVFVDYEDLPFANKKQWRQLDSGLFVQLEHDELEVPSDISVAYLRDLTPAQTRSHNLAQGLELKNKLIQDPFFSREEIGRSLANLDDSIERDLGVLVTDLPNAMWSQEAIRF